MFAGVSSITFRGQIAPRIWDLTSWLICLPLATSIRFDGNPPTGILGPAVLFGLALGVVQGLLAWLLAYTRGRRVVGSFDEVTSLVAATGATALIGSLYVVLVSPLLVPGSVPIIGGLLALGLMLGARFTIRSVRRRRLGVNRAERVLIYGAGESGDQIVRQMLTESNSRFLPVGFLDDDPTKNDLRLHGVRVLGDSSRLEYAVQQLGVTVVLVAIAAIRAQRLLELDRRCSVLGAHLRVIPTTSEIIAGAVSLGDISNVSEEDLLGRSPVNTDEISIHSLLSRKRVLITGAGGSIGSEIARQVQRYGPASVGYLDRDESALHALQLSLSGTALLDSETLILADIRDPQRVFKVFDQFKPDLVFHAAALKHLTLLERFPDEAYKTNVLGTRNVLAASLHSNVSVFVNISTDKAADPSSVLGQTKLEAERMTAAVEEAAADPNHTVSNARYMSVRFGNVIGSRGSVLSIFRHQIANGGPVTVTSPDVSRYFMTIAEAVHLVLQAVALGRHGETMVLDMGEPVLIADVAQRLINKSGRDIPIVFTGLRPGEKCNETLIADDEILLPPTHPLISRIKLAPTPKAE